MSPATETRVVVCGSTFGRFYSAALQRPDCPLRLAGIVGRDSERSRRHAQRMGVPLYDCVENMPKEIGIACVVVRSGAMGGQGTQLAQALLTRGVHVLQEQPVHHDEVAECLALARIHGCHYRVNGFYPYLPSIRDFIATCQRIQTHQAPQYLDLACAHQVLYPLTEILSQALGGLHPWAFTDPPRISEDLARTANSPFGFQTLQGVIAGVPTTLRVHNEVNAADPDNHLHLFHRICLGFTGGNLTLLNTHGPMSWNPQLYMPESLRDSSVFTDSDELALRSSAAIGGSEGPTFRRILEEQWPQGLARALEDFQASIVADENPLRSGRSTLGVCRLWQELTTRVGYPVTRELPPLSMADLDPLKRPPVARPSRSGFEASHP